MSDKIETVIEIKDEKTRAELERLLAPKEKQDTTYTRIVNGVFFKHTIRASDGKHTVEIQNGGSQ